MHACVSPICHSFSIDVYPEDQNQGELYTAGREDKSSLYVQVELRGRTQNSLYVQLSGEEEEGRGMSAAVVVAGARRGRARVDLLPLRGHGLMPAA